MLHLMRRKYLIIGGSILLALGLGVAASSKLLRPDPVTLPEQTAIHVTLNNALASDENRPGDHFEATVSEPVVIDNKTVIPEGTEVEGLVVDAHHSGRIMGRARLRLALESVAIDGKTYDIRTDSNSRIGRNHKNRDIGFIGGGAGGGLLIGATAAGARGALIGGPIGAGAGTAVAFFTGRKDIHLRAETPLTFRLAAPVTVTEKS